MEPDSKTYQRKDIDDGHFHCGYYHLGDNSRYPYSGIYYNKSLETYLICDSCKLYNGKISYYYEKKCTYTHFKNGDTQIVRIYNDGSAMDPDFSGEYYTYIFKNGDKFLVDGDKDIGDFIKYKTGKAIKMSYSKFQKYRENRIIDLIKKRLGSYLKKRRKVWYSPDYKWKSTGLSMIDKMHDLQK